MTDNRMHTRNLKLSQIRDITHAFLCCVLFIAFCIPKGHASNLIELPTFNYKINLTKQEFEADTVERRVTPLNDPSLAFKVRLRENWSPLIDSSAEETSVALNTRFLEKIAHFISPPVASARVSFEVHALKLDHFIDTKDWFLLHILDSGYTLLGFDGRYKNRLHAEYVDFTPDGAVNVHTVIMKNGDKIIYASLRIPSQFSERNKGLAVRIINSFKLLNRSQETPVALNTYALLDIAAYLYPENWTARALQDPSLQMISSTLAQTTWDEDGEPLENVKSYDGLIENYMIAKTAKPDLEPFYSELKDKVSARNIEIKEALAPNKDIFKGADAQRYTVTATRGRYIDYEYWIITRDVGEYWFVSTLFTPAYESSFENWAKNTAIHDVVVRSFTVF